jgi:hypothetical protein
MEAIAAAAEEAREEEAANGPPKLPVFAAQPKPDWWRPELILPVLREVATRGCFATAVAGLVDRFPVVYGAPSQRPSRSTRTP